VRIYVAAAAVSGIEYGVLSAHRAGRTTAENSYSHSMLQGDLNAMGYEPIESIGEWDGIPEKCWIVPGMKPELLLELGTKYRQEAIVYCPPGGKPSVFEMDWLEELV
jgi:hypothetical protein